MTRNRVWLGYSWETLRAQWSPWVQVAVLRQSPSQFDLLFLYPGFFWNQQQSRPFSVLRAGL